MKLFLDANIFFAAVASLKGGSAFIIELAKKKKLLVVTVTQTLLEAERNIKNKLGTPFLLSHYQNILEVKPNIQPIHTVSLDKINALEKFIPLKDVPILLGAILSNPQFLITLDKKDFLENARLKTLDLPFKIITPGEFLTRYLKR